MTKHLPPINNKQVTHSPASHQKQKNDIDMTLLFLGTTEIIIIAAVVLLLFGGAKLPELMRGLGKGIREFKDASREVKKEINDEPNDKTEEQK